MPVDFDLRMRGTASLQGRPREPRYRLPWRCRSLGTASPARAGVSPRVKPVDFDLGMRGTASSRSRVSPRYRLPGGPVSAPLAERAGVSPRVDACRLRFGDARDRIRRGGVARGCGLGTLRGRVPRSRARGRGPAGRSTASRRREGSGESVPIDRERQRRSPWRRHRAACGSSHPP